MHGGSTILRLRAALLVALAATALIAGACGNADPSSGSGTTADRSGNADRGGNGSGEGDFPTVDAPGVTDTEIRVAGVAAVTNPLGGSYGGAFDGVEAYFAMINEEEGGVYGRELVLAEKEDDQFANNKAVVDGLVAADIFAVVGVATLLFTGANSLVEANIPTFGWNINPEWSGTPDDPRLNMFGQTGSYLGFDDTNPGLPYLAKEIGAEKLGVLAYTAAQSAECADGVKNSFDLYGEGVGAEIVYLDKTLNYGDKNLGVQVGKMKDAGVDFVTTCMDTNGVVTLATEMDKAGLDAVQYLPNGYDDEFLAQYGDLFEGSLVRTDFVPWNLPEDEQPQGTKDYVEWMGKAGKTLSENSAAGWLNAHLFVDGLKAAGEDFDRQKLIDVINSFTDWNAGGMVPDIDWTKQHTEKKDPDVGCDFISRIEDGEFTTPFSKPGKPFLCVDASDPANLKAINEA